MSLTFSLSDIARLPLPDDNVAIAVRKVDAGTEIRAGDARYHLSGTVLEGHRFAVRPIPRGTALLSWGLPFGYAVTDIAPGEYVCNQSVLESLRPRRLSFELPTVPNFRDSIEPYVLDRNTFSQVDQVPLHDDTRTFMGFRRSSSRGVGTRNYIVLLGTTSLTGSFVRQLEARLQGLARDHANIDGIVAVAHTEGGEKPNNLDYVLRTLAGFMVHPNVGAVVAFDYGVEPVNNDMLRAYMAEHDYPLDQVPHRFVTLSGSFLDNLDEADLLVREWLPLVNATQRTAESVANLRVALQCGGSDAFSGISGNPLSAWVAREIIQYGGSANLAETDELIGAEPYILQRVRDLETAQDFLDTIERFKQRAAWHGHTAEGNPSGGNKFRGLYNIVLKSIGAAMKKDPAVRLDYVLEYAERMQNPGYYFMNSPGNDLESIAGQVASGSNMIFFVTGNGSVTNFPFVPTIKVVTTTKRFELLSRDMDVNAGEYLDGTPMDELGRRMFALTLDVASGQRSVGEKAGHAQVQLWRNWRQTDDSHIAELLAIPRPAGKSVPLRLASRDWAPNAQVTLIQSRRSRSTEKVGLIVPTSLCSSQVAQMAAAQLNSLGMGMEKRVSRFVTLTHTEGCGNSSGTSEELYVRTLLGYVQHPMAEFCLFLEHGCEKTHNDYIRAQLQHAGVDLSDFGWSSIQLDGGIDAALANVQSWFEQAIDSAEQPISVDAGIGSLRLGIAASGPVTEQMAKALADLAVGIVGDGGTVIVPQNSSLLRSGAFKTLMGDQPQIPTLAYGDSASESGFHIMETPTAHWVEILTGLGATGAEIVVGAVSEVPLQAHPMVPVLQVTDTASSLRGFAADVDLTLTGPASTWNDLILKQVIATAEGRYGPKLYQLGNIDFQITRGLLGVSL